MSVSMIDGMVWEEGGLVGEWVGACTLKRRHLATKLSTLELTAFQKDENSASVLVAIDGLHSDIKAVCQACFTNIACIVV